MRTKEARHRVGAFAEVGSRIGMIALLLSATGCARGAVGLMEDDSVPGMSVDPATDPGMGLVGDAQTPPGQVEDPASDSGLPMPMEEDPGVDVPGPMDEEPPQGQGCEGALGGSCETLAGSITLDASDDSSRSVQQGMGDAWFAFDLFDGNIGSISTTRIGVLVSLDVPSGANYRVNLVGDTSPGGAGRCTSADITDTDPLSKTAIWGSFGPNEATLRQLAVHVESVDGTCDAWTLTVHGSPCPAFTVGFGEDSMGSCP